MDAPVRPCILDRVRQWAPMARRVRDRAIETRDARRKLKASGKPYWRAIGKGLHVGYRKGKTSGVWVIRRYLGDQNYSLQTIAEADDVLDADGIDVLDFWQAQEAAQKSSSETEAGRLHRCGCCPRLSRSLGGPRLLARYQEAAGGFRAPGVRRQEGVGSSQRMRSANGIALSQRRRQESARRSAPSKLTVPLILKNLRPNASGRHLPTAAWGFSRLR